MTLAGLVASQALVLCAVLAGEERWCVLEADCATVLPALPPKSVAHVLTDPPYETEAHTLLRRVKRTARRDAARGTDSRVAEIEALAFPPLTEGQRAAYAAEFGRLCQRWAIVFCQIEAAMRWQSALIDAGMARRRIGVWVKPDGQPQLSGDRPGMGFESIVFTHAAGRSTWHGGGRSSVFTCNKWIPADGANVHPTQKPLPLLVELVELFTNPGDVVLDPFCGSGSLGIACARLGRRYIGMDNGADENGKPWAEWAREGIQAEEKGLSRSAARAGQSSLFGDTQ